MRFACLCLGFLLFLPAVQAQSTSPGTITPTTGGTATGTASTSPLQDPQAVSILNQAITAAGGAQAIRAVSDFTATGTITLYAGTQAQGTVTVRGLNSTEIRIDATLPTGVRSWAVHDGISSAKSEIGKIISQAPNRNVPSSDAVPFQTPLFPVSLAFPVRPLVTIVAKQVYGVSSESTTQVDGHSVSDIRLTRSSVLAGGSSNASMPPIRSRDLFIDTSSFQIVMMREMLPRKLMHEVHYSNYQSVSGVLMPFDISEYMGGQQTWSIQLTQITFNSGLQGSVFALQ